MGHCRSKFNFSTGSETNSRQVRGHWGFFEICRTYEYENNGETSEACTSTDDEDFSG